PEAGFERQAGAVARDAIEGNIEEIAREMQPGRAIERDPAKDAGADDRGAAQAGASMPSFSMNFTIVSSPCPVFRLEKTNGLCPRIFFASRSITSSDAPTIGARSILLMTSRSDLTMPGPPFLGILSPAATSIT